MLLYWGIGLYVLFALRSDQSRGGMAVRIIIAVVFFILGICHFVYPQLTF